MSNMKLGWGLLLIIACIALIAIAKGAWWSWFALIGVFVGWKIDTDDPLGQRKGSAK